MTDIKEKTKENEPAEPKKTAAPPKNMLKNKPFFSWAKLAVVSILGVQNYGLFILHQKINLLEGKLNHHQKTYFIEKEKFDALDTKLKNLEKQILAMPKENPEASKDQQSFIRDSLQNFSLSEKQLSDIFESIKNAFVLKSDLKEVQQSKLTPLLYMDVLKQAVMSGKPYDKILETTRTLVLSNTAVKPEIVTAFDILKLSAATGLPSLSLLYQLPENNPVTSMHLPSWLDWIKDYMKITADVSKGLSSEARRRLMEMIESGRLAEAYQTVNRHIEEHSDQKNLWEPWLKTMDVRLKTLQSIDLIQQNLLESAVS